VEQIRSEFIAAGERAREFAAKPASGTAPLPNDFDAYTRFLGPDGAEREAQPAAQPTTDAETAPRNPDAPEAAPAAPVDPQVERGALRDAQPAGAPAFSAQLRAAAALRAQLDARLLASLRAPIKNRV
jgi:hypothetical protein